VSKEGREWLVGVVRHIENPLATGLKQIDETTPPSTRVLRRADDVSMQGARRRKECIGKVPAPLKVGLNNLVALFIIDSYLAFTISLLFLE